MTHLAVENLCFSHTKDRVTLEDVSFSVEKGEFCCLVGPSGSGKSTLLKLIAGLLKPERGTVSFNNKTLNDNLSFVPPENRKMGFVFQDGALFPHLNALRNVMFGLQGKSKSEQKKYAEEWLSKVSLLEHKDQYPHELSGGQMQRVALARALAPGPQLLLLDEPFSGLDEQLRKKLGRFTRQLCEQENLTVVLVTHHPEEALELADSVAVMDAGRLIQKSTVRDVYRNPANRFVMEYFGDCFHYITEVKQGKIHLPNGRERETYLQGSVVVCIRNEAFSFAEVGQQVHAKFVKKTFDKLGRGYFHFHSSQLGELVLPYEGQNDVPQLYLKEDLVKVFAI